jgi:hypothetical protein
VDIDHPGDGVAVGALGARRVVRGHAASSAIVAPVHPVVSIFSAVIATNSASSRMSPAAVT